MREQSSIFKFVAFIFSLSISVYTALTLRNSYSLKYRIVFENMPDGFTVSNLRDTFIDVNLSCPYIMSGTSFFRKNDRSVKVKLPDNFSPILNLDMMNEKYDIPPLCSILSVSPRFITFEFERVVSRVVQVKPDIVGSLPEGYTYSVSVEPERVIISGPESEIRGKEFIFTEIVDIEGRKDSFSIEVPISKFSSSVKIAPETVKVFVDIKKKGN